MKTILIPTDFSSSARNAALYAIATFGQEQTKFILVNAYSMPPHPSSGLLIDLNVELRKDSVNALKQEKKAILNDLGAGSNIDLDTFADEGTLSTVVESMVKHRSIDFVVMGTLGASGLEEVFVGSNAYDVARDAICPVIIVPESTKFTRPGKIAFAADYVKLNDLSVLNPLIQLAEQLDLTVHAINIVTEVNGVAPDNSDERAKISECFKNVRFDSHTLVHEDAEEGIEEFVASQEIDLVVVISRETGFFDTIFQRSTTRKLVLHTSVPVLVLRDK